MATKGASKLVKITARAKQIRKAKPQMKWTNAIKEASKELAKVKVSGTKKTSDMQKTKSANSGAKKVVVVTGHQHKRQHKRVSGLKTHQKPMDMLMLAGGNIIGGALGAIVYNRAPGSNLIKGAIEAGLGFTGMLMINQKHNLLFGIANGVTTGGGVNMLHSTGVMHGVDSMVAGLFDGLNGTEERYIPAQTAGHRHHLENGAPIDNSYVSAISKDDIDKWVHEGIPAQGADSWL